MLCFLSLPGMCSWEGASKEELGAQPWGPLTCGESHPAALLGLHWQEERCLWLWKVGRPLYTISLPPELGIHLGHLASSFSSSHSAHQCFRPVCSQFTWFPSPLLGDSRDGWVVWKGEVR